MPHDVDFGGFHLPLDARAVLFSVERGRIGLGHVERREEDADAPRAGGVEERAEAPPPVEAGVGAHERLRRGREGAVIAHQKDLRVSRRASSPLRGVRSVTATRRRSRCAARRGLEPRVRNAREDLPRLGAAEDLVDGDAAAQGELVERLSGEGDGERAGDRLDAGLQVLGLREALDGRLPEALLAEHGERHRGREREQPLIRADVRRGPLAPDVLLARGERQAEARPAVRVRPCVRRGGRESGASRRRGTRGTPRAGRRTRARGRTRRPRRTRCRSRRLRAARGPRARTSRSRRRSRAPRARGRRRRRPASPRRRRTRSETARRPRTSRRRRRPRAPPASVVPSFPSGTSTIVNGKFARYVRRHCRYTGCTPLETTTFVFFFVRRSAMSTASTKADAPSYIEAFATSSPVRSAMCVWNSQIAVSVPWATSA